ncbi:DNA damage-inducible transcript 4 protein-like [Coregonus clupeaformis]|uniref:DNA damage-inducible transcript 4 protein n=1 Tax=Coregonus suidteri TaxID=861788 RepID=A0AAN8Q7C9_9TELE|nr:DNA damage-inducible transcript 4 protein-like [Coregonus clupeaformis]
MSFTSSHNNSLDDSFSPSPQDDLGSQRLSWGNLVQKLTVLKRINQRLADKDHCSWNSETGSVTDMSMISESESGLFYSPLEESVCAQVVKTIVESLSDATNTVLCCSKLVLPDPLLHNISRELLHLAASEPCGLKGALIDLCVEQGDQQGELGGKLCSVEQIAVDHNLVPTFHLTLVLRPEVGGFWPKVQRLFGGRVAVSPQRQSGRHTLRLSTGFRAIKRKLYSSGELLIEEC